MPGTVRSPVRCSASARVAGVVTSATLAGVTSGPAVSFRGHATTNHSRSARPLRPDRGPDRAVATDHTNRLLPGLSRRPHGLGVDGRALQRTLAARLRRPQPGARGDADRRRRDRYHSRGPAGFGVGAPFTCYALRVPPRARVAFRGDRPGAHHRVDGADRAGAARAAGDSGAPGQYTGDTVMPSAPGPRCAPMTVLASTTMLSAMAGTRRSICRPISSSWSLAPNRVTAMSARKPPDFLTARSTILASARRVPGTRASGATSPPLTVSSGLMENAEPIIACAAPIRPPRRRYSSVPT